MNTLRWILAGVVAFGLGAGLWRHRSNERLRGELGDAAFADGGSSGGLDARRSRNVGGAAVDPVQRIESVLRSLGEAAGSGDSKRAESLQARVSRMIHESGDRMDSDDLVSLMESLVDSGDLADDVRRRLMSLVGDLLADKNPAALMGMVSEHPQSFDPSFIRRQAGALQGWAELDPEAAMRWYEEHRSLLPSDEDAGLFLLAGAARKDPRTAFRMLRRLSDGSGEEEVHAIMSAGSDHASGRTGLLGALREHLESMDDAGAARRTGAKALEILARGIDGEDYASVVEWVESVRLSPAERDSFASGLTWFGTGKETGRWVEWISRNVSAGEAAGPVRELVGEWTQQDYRAAGEWLAADSGMTPQVRADAVAAYAAEVAGYDPQVAVQWVLTLPDGETREATLREVHENWPASDPEGAAAFAREHKIE